MFTHKLLSPPKPVIRRQRSDVGDPGLIRCYEVATSDLSRFSPSITVSLALQAVLKKIAVITLGPIFQRCRQHKRL